ncbi:hypothetical protein E8E12_007419 [Didymella heteroderae]|uniref:Apple domain-containing protein n=1 Tax=Didymella heteroderae TaxID=1769908 RepID=A0A9P4WWS2_9PLEO|nr:hypothetical protein E8E12_007419 [Didymella heteroderae]
MIANISWHLPLMVLLCSIVSSTDAWLFARVTASSVLTITDHVSATTTSASSLSLSSLALVVPVLEYEKVQAASWCSWGQGQQYKGYLMQCGVDYFHGGDLFDQWAKNIDDCVAMCNDTPDCKLISYQVETDDGLCGMNGKKSYVTRFVLGSQQSSNGCIYDYIFFFGLDSVNKDAVQECVTHNRSQTEPHNVFGSIALFDNGFFLFVYQVIFNDCIS